MQDQIRDTLDFAKRHLRVALNILTDHKVKAPQDKLQSFMGSLSNIAGHVMLVLVLGLLLRTVFVDVFLYAVSWFESSFAYGFVAVCLFVGGTALFVRVFIQGISLMKAYYLLPLYGAYRGFVSLYQISQQPEVQNDFICALKAFIGLL